MRSHALVAVYHELPTLSLAGQTVAGRQGSAILGHLGLDEFVAKNVTDFEQKGLYWAGNLAGSLIAYYVTRRYGERFVLSRAGRWLGLSRGHLRLAHRFFDRFGVWAVFLGRLLPIIRTYISFPAGLSTVRPRTFVIATLLGAFPWNLGLAYAGLKLGQHYDTVSRYHAVIVDTGNSFVITDLQSANGVDVGDRRIRISATLADGDRICICGHEFTFEMCGS